MTFTASDGSLTDSEDVIITVSDVNQPPALNAIGSKTVAEGQSLTFTISATDPEGAPLTFSATGVPAWASFDPATRTFSGTPGFTDAGSSSVTFSVTDGALSGSEIVTITVTPVDRAPVLDEITPKTVDEGSALSFTVHATDPDGDTVTYSATNLPSGATFSDTTGAFSWTPDLSAQGPHSVTFTASAGTQHDSKTVTITVNDINRPPVLEAIGDKSVAEGAALSFTITASDPDNDPITYEATGLSAGATFDAQSRSFGWTPGYADAGSYQVTFTVTAGGMVDFEKVTISVSNTDRAPVWTPIPDQTVDEGATLSFTVTASDPDNDPITYSPSGIPAGATFDAGTRTFSWTPGFTDAGTHTATFTATAGGASTPQPVTITVRDLNRPPVVAAGNDVAGTEGALVAFSGAFTDDGDTGSHTIAWGFGDGSTASNTLTPSHTYVDNGVYTVTLTVTDAAGAPASDTLVVTVANAAPVVNAGTDKSATTGSSVTFSGTFTDAGTADTHSFAWVFGDGSSSTEQNPTHTYATAGTYTATLTVTDDDGGAGTDSITVTVTDPAPIARDDTYSTAEDQQLAVPTADGVLKNDAYVPGATARVTTGPMHGTLALNPDGSFTFTPTADYYGSDSFTYTVTAGTQTSAAATVTITVTDVNDPPTAAFTFLPAAPTTGGAVTFSDSSSDRDGTVASCSWTFGDSGSATGGTPTHAFTAAGTYTVTLTATDDDGATATMMHSVIVTQANQAPMVAAGNDLAGTEGAPVAFSGGFTDAGDAGAHAIAWSFGDGGSASGSLTPSHTYVDNGVYTATLTVTDAAGLKASDTLTVTVANAVTVISGVTVPPDPVAVGTSVTATATFTDAGTADTHTATWTWGDSSATMAGTITGSTVSGTHAYTEAGVYQVTVTVTDDDGGVGTGTAPAFLVVYDPDGGFVTGGGWIQSPAGAYSANPAMTGKANFGFVSKYQKGATVPTGETQFDFKAAGLEFHSTSYDWLVIAGAKAQYKGTGTINGAGNYGFMLTAIDGQVLANDKPDLFRLKIWDKATGAIVYDNKMNAPDTDDPTTGLGGGSIVVHKK